MVMLSNLSGGVPATQAQPQPTNSGAPNWRDFRFSNPTSPDQQNFNYLAGIDPMAAFGYGFGGTGEGPGGSAFSNELRHSIDAYVGDPSRATSAAILGIYHGGVDPTSGLGQLLGLTDAEGGTRAGQMGGSGQYTWNGQNYQLPNQVNWGQHTFWGQPVGTNLNAQDLAFAQQNDAHNRSANAAQQNNAIGGQSWWHAVQDAQNPQAGSAGGAPGIPPGATPPPGTQVISDPNMVPQGAQTTQAAGGSNFPAFGAGQQYQFTPSGQYNDPGYQFRMDEGMKALMSQKAATGSLGSGQTLKDITNYGQNAASQEFANAYNRFNTDRAFNYGVNTDDRNFAYNAATGDRNYNLQSLMGMGQLGLQGAQGGGYLASTLASLLSGNLNTLGQVGGTGTIAGGNNINQTISNILSQLAQQGVLQKYLPNLG